MTELPKSTYKFTIYGQKRAKREPIIDPRTKEVIDDGTNHPIVCGGGADKKTANQMMENVKANVPKGTWGFWIEENKDL